MPPTYRVDHTVPLHLAADVEAPDALTAQALVRDRVEDTLSTIRGPHGRIIATVSADDIVVTQTTQVEPGRVLRRPLGTTEPGWVGP
jgi:hypothetical protein